MNNCKENFRPCAFARNYPFLATVLFLLASAHCFGAKSIKRGSVTWTFDRDYPAGQFANGDWYVVSTTGITITSISPSWDGQKNGAQINPLMNKSLQGLDKRISTSGINYDGNLNVADDLPISLYANQTLVSVVGKDNASRSPWMEEAQVLTVLPTEPPANSFRPPYAGTDKTIRGTTDDIDWNWVLDLPHPPNARSPNRAIGNIQIDWWEQWQSSDLKTANTEHTYGRAIAYEAATAVLWLHLSNSRSKKEEVMIDLIQRGIDNFGLVKSDRHGWWPNGGHNLGRKLPFLIAAKALNDSEMMTYSTSEKGGRRAWHEDEQHFYVSSEQIDKQPALNTNGTRPYSDRTPYLAEHLGMADWTSNGYNERHRATPKWTGWSGSGYRFANGGPNVGQVAAAMLSGLESAWDAPAFFDYIRERYWPAEEDARQNAFNQIYLFHAEMFERAVDGDYSWTLPSIELETPKFDRQPGLYLSEQNVTISSSDGLKIYYTLDGSTPSQNSFLYSQPLHLQNSTLVKAVAVRDDGKTSSVASLDMVINDFVSSSLWQNVPLSELAGISEFSFTAVPPNSDIDTVMGFSQNPVVNYSEMACLIRFNSDGFIDARNGSKYQAEGAIPYTANTEYTFLIKIDTTNKTYSVYARTNPYDSAIVAKDYQFRTESLNTDQINYFATKSLYDDPVRIAGIQGTDFENEVLYPSPQLTFSHPSGSYESMTLDLSITSDQDDSEIFYTVDGTAPTPGNASTSLYTKPLSLSQSMTVKAIGVSTQNTLSQLTSVDITVNELASTENWKNLDIGPQTESFSFNFSGTAPAAELDGVVGFGAETADSYSDLACIIRFNDAGYIDARDSNIYRSDSIFEYEPNVEYQFTVKVDFATKRYSVTVLDPENGPVKIADGFYFRSEQNHIESINYLSTRTLAPNNLKIFSLGFPTQRIPSSPYGLILSKIE
ncbi:chitobiase/beta-hexosaminidase C-terminal domain-containing protein [Pelagicoccus sp. SDUM812002]|uniref:chitobiase/beta-hexosaminidase C-terminal domain-containing protein n=1 Tax=Pelagicoccus sp. SDUM812002 TaxID=3041266 RepID=UPI00280FCBCD|nr:chitobiase/beta-hexosaminidase C-terminal domain-containing protein [Pelagicoccus sp. SDUM812002]MDQ8188060.1 chitobiase/beta-hexosaminidase C-terminal domain-containing protein [Pelagicoccus sp. SDUM812002]